MTNAKNFDFAKIIKRLEMIKSLITMEEEDELNIHISKLQQQSLPIEVDEIIMLLQKKYYGNAISSIEVFIQHKQGVSIFSDPEIDAFKLEIKSLESLINNLSNEKAELEKLIHDFGIRHNRELGEIVSKILKYRRDSAATQKDKSAEKRREYEEAKDDYENYSKQFIENKNEEQFELIEDELKELKSKYRKASKLCHPDVVADELKENAELVFKELKKAYEKNDLKKVREIFDMLSKGEMFISKSESITEKLKLRAEVIKLRNLAEELRAELTELTNSETYKSIIKIEDWDSYFKETKEKLKQELKTIEN